MALKPEVSIPVAVGTGVLVWGIYKMNMPVLADVKATSASSAPIESSRTVSTWEAAAAVAAISLISHDPTVFVIGGMMVIFFDFAYRYSNAQDPATGQVSAKVAANVSGSGGGAEAMITG